MGNTPKLCKALAKYIKKKKRRENKNKFGCWCVYTPATKKTCNVFLSRAQLFSWPSKAMMIGIKLRIFKFKLTKVMKYYLSRLMVRINGITVVFTKDNVPSIRRTFVTKITTPLSWKKAPRKYKNEWKMYLIRQIVTDT